MGKGVMVLTNGFHTPCVGEVWPIPQKSGNKATIEESFSKPRIHYYSVPIPHTILPSIPKLVDFEY